MKRILILIKWALIFFATGLLWMALERLFGLHAAHISIHPIITNFFIIPAVLVVVLGLKELKKKYYNSRMTYLQGFLSSMIMTVFIILLSPLSQWITSYVITPEYFPNAINYSVASGKMTLAEANTYFSFNNYVIEGAIGGFIMGTLTSLIVPIFLKSKKAKQF